ncbi:hypothetical protein [Burkholderia metallica]|uniref:hypothetical protein n=1 Tax=Burkholderia metallica TaxID=488729 RepID=UPI00157685AF|nr:hypothetical protein [Burkholderia metallica]NTZ09174.1 hypothetical protein [Burkholderia metallica]
MTTCDASGMRRICGASAARRQGRRVSLLTLKEGDMDRKKIIFAMVAAGARTAHAGSAGALAGDLSDTCQVSTGCPVSR